MRLQILRLCFVLLATGCLTLSWLSAETAIIRGSVRDADGNPLIARISILKGPSTPSIETHDTDSTGRSPSRPRLPASFR